MLTVGSRAMFFYFGESYRRCKDYDYVVCEGREECPKSITVDNIRNEYHSLPEEIYDELAAESWGNIVCPEHLYTIKLSHSFWDIHWQKTAWDIIWCQKKGLVYDEALFNKLYALWIVKHGKKRAYLKKKNEEFFNDAVDRVYIHDDLHKAVAYYDAPLYELIKEDNTSAMTSSSLFNKLTQTDKLRLCREEIYVTALERFLIPTNFRTPVMTAYRRAINRLVTSMTKGWFPKYIMLNLNILWELEPEYNFVDKFNIALTQGLIRNVNKRRTRQTV